MHNIHIRNLDDNLLFHLKEQAINESISMNKLIIRLLQKAINPPKSRQKIRHDFDKFAGSWTKEEGDAFEKNTTSFSKIDEELWK